MYAGDAGIQGVVFYAGIQGVELYAVQGVDSGDVCSWGLCLCYNGLGCGAGKVPRPRAEGDINNALTPPPPHTRLSADGFPGDRRGGEKLLREEGGCQVCLPRWKS